jgi:uncharacterized protein (TIGR02145 family)
MRQIITACALAIVTTGVAQSTLPTPHGGAATAKPWLNPALTYGSVKDIDGNTYATIEIGTQVWMAENLRTTRYRNGDPIPNVTDDRKWTDLSSGARCYYENDPKYEVPYGMLYNWFTVSDARKVCPAGWHVPTDAEWMASADHHTEYVTGGQMKSAGTQHWQAPNEGATNSSGFSGLPGGFRSRNDGLFNYLGYNGYWWSASENVAEGAWYRYLNANIAPIARYGHNKRYGFSVRCLRD